MDADDEVSQQDALTREAKRNPNGWVYKIDGDFGHADPVPPEAIAGAWKINSNGEIEGDFIPNPNYKLKNPEPR